jgi:glyoxylase-like metal-dependent hydrolase (beta-lactamase superfamily II)
MSDFESLTPEARPEDVPFSAAIVPVTPLMQNCTILVCNITRQAAIVDPGGDVPLILQSLERLEARPEAIWLTHGHFDHVGGAAELREKLDIPVIGPHREDEWLLSDVEAQAEMFGVPGGRSVTPDRWLEEGDTVTFGEHAFEVRHCPGHTPGHVLYVNRAAGAGLFGDVLFHGSIGRTDFPRSDHGALMRCIREKILTLPDDLEFIPGHGPPSTIGEERANNTFLRQLH